jgi:hypothetical protein
LRQLASFWRPIRSAALLSKLCLLSVVTSQPYQTAGEPRGAEFPCFSVNNDH